MRGSSMPSKRSERSHATSSAPVISVVAMRGNLAAELVRPRDGRAAGEPLADVDRGRAVDETLACEERHVVRGAHRDDRLGREPGERSPSDVRADVTGDRELPRRGEVERERAERPREVPRCTPERGREEPQNTLAATDQLLVSPEPAETEEHRGHHRV